MYEFFPRSLFLLRPFLNRSLGHLGRSTRSLVCLFLPSFPFPIEDHLFLIESSRASLKDAQVARRIGERRTSIFESYSSETISLYCSPDLCSEFSKTPVISQEQSELNAVHFLLVGRPHSQPITCHTRLGLRGCFQQGNDSARRVLSEFALLPFFFQT